MVIPQPAHILHSINWASFSLIQVGWEICSGQGNETYCGPGTIGAACTPGGEQPGYAQACFPFGIFCDPQLGCSNRLVAEDLSEERSWQLSQEFRIASHFSGPFNFSGGGNYLHYETAENYYVFINSLTLAAYSWEKGTGGQPYQTLPWVPGVSDNSNCLQGGFAVTNPNVPTEIGPFGGALGTTSVCISIPIPSPASMIKVTVIFSARTHMF